MGVLESGEPKQFLKIDLAGCRIEKIGPSDHVGDALSGIIHHNGKVVRVESVGTKDDEIAYLLGNMLLTAAVYPVGKMPYSLSGKQAYRAWAFGRWYPITTGAGVDGAFEACSARFYDLPSGTAARIGKPLFY